MAGSMASNFSGDIVAIWDLSLSDKLHRIEFEHGTTTGKRVIRVDGKEIFRQDWMFKLIGKSMFKLNQSNCEIIIDAVTGFAYEYTLIVNGKSLNKFRENMRKNLRTWISSLNGQYCRVVFEKDTCDVWVNGDKLQTTGEFSDDGDGVETHFQIPGAEGHSSYIKAVSSGKRQQGIVHTLIINDQEIPEAPPDC